MASAGLGQSDDGTRRLIEALERDLDDAERQIIVTEIPPYGMRSLTQPFFDLQLASIVHESSEAGADGIDRLT